VADERGAADQAGADGNQQDAVADAWPGERPGDVADAGRPQRRSQNLPSGRMTV
jgi:hypothetical protein